MTSWRWHLVQIAYLFPFWLWNWISALYWQNTVLYWYQRSTEEQIAVKEQVVLRCLVHHCWWPPDAWFSNVSLWRQITKGRSSYCMNITVQFVFVAMAIQDIQYNMLCRRWDLGVIVVYDTCGLNRMAQTSSRQSLGEGHNAWCQRTTLKW